VIVDTDTQTVAIRWTATGTHSGPMAGVQPTGERLAFRGIEIIRVTDRRIAERWGESDAPAVVARLARKQSPKSFLAEDAPAGQRRADGLEARAGRLTVAIIEWPPDERRLVERSREARRARLLLTSLRSQW
jgi:hypothetical protein